MNSWDLCILLKSKGVLVSHFPISTGGPSVVRSHDRLSPSPLIPHGPLQRTKQTAKSNRGLTHDAGQTDAREHYPVRSSARN